MDKRIKIKFNNIETNIIIKNNFFDKYIKKLINENKNIFCIIDKKLKKLVNSFDETEKLIKIFVNGSEDLKSFNNYLILCNKLLEKNIDRNSTIIAIGGGTIGDISGFIASSILRGVKFIFIPTTLLSQVDSSIGGKNGINTKHGKNLVGTFYQPKEILIDISILNSLPKKEMRSGYSEIIKHALIKDYSFFCWLEKNANKLLNLNKSILEEAIYRSIMIKLFYVRKDEKEFLLNKNSRAMLNFGHTIGHAVESHYNYKKFNHGEAISIGMVTEAKISNYLGLLSSNDLDRIITHFQKCKLQTFDNIIKDKRLIKKIIKDKKNFLNKINFSLIDKIGSSIFYKKLDKHKVHKILQDI